MTSHERDLRAQHAQPRCLRRARLRGRGGRRRERRQSSPRYDDLVEVVALHAAAGAGADLDHERQLVDRARRSISPDACPMPNGSGLMLVSPDTDRRPRSRPRVTAAVLRGVSTSSTPRQFGVPDVLRPGQCRHARRILGDDRRQQPGCAGYHTLNGLDGAVYRGGVRVHRSRQSGACASCRSTTPTAEAVEFYNAALDHYFISHTSPTRSRCSTRAPRSRAGRAPDSRSRCYAAAGAATSPVCRFYIPPAQGDSHFYGRGTHECDATQAANPTFVNEDPQFFHMTLPTARRVPRRHAQRLPRVQRSRRRQSPLHGRSGDSRRDGGHGMDRRRRRRGHGRHVRARLIEASGLRQGA